MPSLPSQPSACHSAPLFPSVTPLNVPPVCSLCLQSLPHKQGGLILPGTTDVMSLHCQESPGTRHHTWPSQPGPAFKALPTLAPATPATQSQASSQDARPPVPSSLCTSSVLRSHHSLEPGRPGSPVVLTASTSLTAHTFTRHFLLSELLRVPANDAISSCVATYPSP